MRERDPDQRTEPDPSRATFLFADIAGFTALTEAHGDEQAADLVGEFSAAVQRELPSCGGSHVKTIGDALMLAIPDAADAVLFALRITDELMRRHGAPAASRSHQASGPRWR